MKIIRKSSNQEELTKFSKEQPKQNGLQKEFQLWRKEIYELQDRVKTLENKILIIDNKNKCEVQNEDSKDNHRHEQVEQRTETRN